MTFLVTGCAGFIGSHLTDRLLADGHKVIGVDNFLTGRFENIEHNLANRNFKFINADITDVHSLSVAFNIEPIDGVFHQAALGSVPRSIETPNDTLKHNVVGFNTVLEFMRLHGIKALVHASSSSIHGRDGVLQSPYAASKKMNESQAEAWCSAYGIGAIGLRYFNVFGSRQNPNGAYAAVIPKWISLLKENKPLIRFGDGEQSRDFTYVKDVVEANLAAFKAIKPREYTAVDIGSGEPFSLNELASELHLAGYSDGNEVMLETIGDRAGDIRHSSADTLYAKKKINFTAKYNLTTGLEDMKCGLE